MQDYSEFTFSVCTVNHGILIRRKFDYSYPNQEARILIRHHGKREWREEEFPISSLYTRGAEKLDIRIEFIPNDQELYPGQSFPEKPAWSESRYWIYSWVLPDEGYPQSDD